MVGGCKDEAKNFMVHNATIIQQSSIRLLIALALALDFNIWAFDVNQAYPLAERALQGDVIIKLDIMDLEPNELLQIAKPIHNLSYLGDY